MAGGVVCSLGLKEQESERAREKEREGEREKEKGRDQCSFLCRWTIHSVHYTTLYY